MRVLHVVPSYIPAWRYGGPIRSVHGLCAGLARAGVEVHICTTNVDGERDSDVPLGRPVEIDGVRVWYHPSRRLRRLYYSPPMAAGLRRQVSGFDLLHLHSVFLWPTWAAARRAVRDGVPYVVSPKGQLVQDLIRRKSRWVKRLWIALIERRTLEGAAAIQVTSRRELDEFRRFGFRTPEPWLIPHGMDLPEGEVTPVPVPPPEGAAPRVVFLGRINWKKGLDRLIPAMVHVPGAELVLAGNDEENYSSSLKELAREAGVANRVTFAGPVRDEGKWDLLRSGTVFVLPSYDENFGIAALEAMAVARPVVVTPEVGMAEIVVEADSGIVVDGAPEKLGPAIDALLRDPARLQHKGANGRRVIEKRLTWDRIALEMRRAYEGIVRQP
jgi:glycosyltransferase involved in cell wall biosynthesis